MRSILKPVRRKNTEMGPLAHNHLERYMYVKMAYNANDPVKFFSHGTVTTKSRDRLQPAGGLRKLAIYVELHSSIAAIVTKPIC